jgi:CubicO group peptidase (beta-lactamase class C family)
MRGRELLLARGYGTADLEHEVPVTVETVFRLGSVTKQFTAAAVLRLVDQGKVSLDDPITKYLPDSPVRGRTVSIRQLLNHTSGIRSYTSLGPAYWRDTFRLDLPPERIAALTANLEPDFEPGTNWLYNNSGFVILGLLIEKVSGQRYSTYLEREIFAPLGLRSTSYCDDVALVPHRARGYDRSGKQLRNTTPLSMSVPYAAGSLCSTVLDLLAWRRALGDGKVISPALYQEMIRPAVLTNGWRTNYGFGLGRYRLGDRGVEVIRHGGTINGFQANLLYVPAADLIVAALANTGGSNPVGIGARIVAAMTGTSLVEPSDRDLSPTEAERYAGRYQLGPWIVEVGFANGQLTAGPVGVEEPAELSAQGNGRFLARSIGAFGFYGAETTVIFSGGEAHTDRLTLQHPLGDTVVGKRLGPDH